MYYVQLIKKGMPRSIVKIEFSYESKEDADIKVAILRQENPSETYEVIEQKK